MKDYSVEPSDNRYGPQAVNPHTEWQIKIETTRAEKKLSLRELASRANVPSGTLFNWVRAKKGAPPRASYTAGVNRRLAKALGIPEKELADLYNRAAFQPVDPSTPEPERPRPAPHLQENITTFTVDGLRRFLHHLKATGRESFTLLELELAASMILDSVKPLDQPPGQNPPI